MTKTANKAVDAITASTNQAVDTVTETAGQKKDSLVNTIEGTSDALEETLQKAEKLNHAASESVQSAISALDYQRMDSVKAWIDSHPLIFWVVQAMRWAMDHPLLALVILLLVVFTLSSFLKLLGRLVEKAWISVLQAPLKLGKFLLKASSKSLSRFGNVFRQPILEQQETLDLQASNFEPVKHDQKDRLANLLTRLEAVNQEQNQLLQEVAAIVGSSAQAQAKMSGRAQIDPSPQSALLEAVPGRDA